MSVKIKLKNSDDFVILDESVYQELLKDIDHKKMLENLRVHSTGCAVYQKSERVKKGEYRIETTYLHRFICEKFVEKLDPELRLVGTKNGNKLDCQLENLEWRTRSMSSRSRRVYNKSGYLGVYQERKKFRSIIYYLGKAHHIGMFSTAEEAAKAYNEKAKEFFGNDARLNKIKNS